MITKSHRAIGWVLLLSSAKALIGDLFWSKIHTCAVQQHSVLYSTWLQWRKETLRLGWGSAQG
jgi:hypothetical protein